jgi:signal transduction histidine kinase
MEEVLLLLEGRIHSLHIHLTSDLPTGVVVEGFPAEMRQVFTNLITNATDAAGENGSINVRITPQPAAATSSGDRSHEGALIEIIDSGPGIAPEDRERLFQPFFTTKGEHGTGLGLWISQGIIRKLGGTLELVPGPDGRGAVARIFLAAKPTINPGGD